MSKYKWGIISDLIRVIKNNSSIGLGEFELECAHDDLADIMDLMIVQKCSFKKALSFYREEDENNAQWIEEALKLIE